MCIMASRGVPYCAWIACCLLSSLDMISPCAVQSCTAWNEYWTQLPPVHRAPVADLVLLPGHTKTVEFEFNTQEDTAENIANEMMEVLSLSEDEARLIAGKIKEEVDRVTRQFVQSMSFGEEGGGGGGPEGAGGSSLAHTSSLDPTTREAVAANAAAHAVAAVAAAAAAANNSLSNSTANTVDRGSAPAPGGPSTGDRSSGAPITDSMRPPSFHDLVRAMREYQEQQQGLAGGQGFEEVTGSPASSLGAMGAPPVEVRLPNGHALGHDLLAKVAATAATAVVQQLEALPTRNGSMQLQQQQQQQQHSPAHSAPPPTPQ